jgi:hypothetical protein
MPEISEKRPSISSARRNTEGKLKLVRSKSKLQNTDTKTKDVEGGSLKGWEKTQIQKNDTDNESKQNNSKKGLEKSDSLNNSSTTNDLKPILKSENSDPIQNGGIPNASDNNSHKTTFIQEDHRKHKKVTKKDSEKRVVLPRDLTKLSIGNLSEASEAVDGTAQSITVAVPTDRPRSVIAHSDSWIRSVIPNLPLGLAIVFLILNIIIPGSG